ncbi:Putative pectinesterase 11 [Linum grandiflorum]
MMIHILPTTIILTLLLLSQTLASSTTTPRNWSVAKLIRVDNSAPGRGDFETIQEAIDSVPSNNSELVFIWVKPGVYVEKVVVPKDKPFVTLGGTKAAANETVVTWNEKGGIFESATFSVLAPYFVARYLTIQNTFGSGGKAVALRVSGDKAAFYDCRILSYQDTLLDDNGSHYYRNCYIEGATDFICGDASSLFEVRYIKCHIHSLSKHNGSITAHDRDSESDQTGYVFLGCKVTGVGATLLGRAWGSYSRVVYAYSYLASNVLPIGWSDWGDKSKQRTVFYGEYKNYGPGADRSKRVAWSKKLAIDEVSGFLSKNMIGGRSWIRPKPKFFRIGSKVFKAGTHGTPSMT